VNLQGFTCAGFTFAGFDAPSSTPFSMRPVRPKFLEQMEDLIGQSVEYKLGRPPTIREVVDHLPENLPRNPDIVDYEDAEQGHW